MSLKRRLGFNLLLAVLLAVALVLYLGANPSLNLR